MVGPSRRSNSALSSDKGSFNTSCQDTPMRNYRTHRRAEFRHPMDGKLRNQRCRRVPFIAWMVIISVYCCIMYAHVASYRALMQGAKQQNSFIDAYQYARALEEDHMEQSSRKKSVPMAQHGNAIETVRENSDAADAELIHVVSTRFMQGQSHLIELGLARLTLFQTFCLPTMLYQSSKDFIWIIRADSDLHPTISGTLVSLLRRKQTFILLGSNENPEGFGRTNPQTSFEDFLNGATVMSGNITLVREAYEKSASGGILLETRLDADDGLHLDYVKTVQNEARNNLVNNDNVHEPSQLWRLWCTNTNIEWHPLNPYPAVPEILAHNNKTIPEGYLVGYTDHTICSTPGLTFGYGAGASRASMGFNHLRHDEIARRIPKCKSDKKDTAIEVECVSRLTELIPGGAVRARTVTSAGMNNVITGIDNVDETTSGFKAKRQDQHLIQQYFRQKEIWRILAEDFAVSNEGATYARSLIVGRMHFIAEENLRGQCTPGHSCKNQTRGMLEKLIV
eukprot:CAMPEP_0183728592 /NCGR_PEP_ID=MMETSP0737-20130205/28462_1 /TAXON_ID=385413 /ORGANISM="Thalassiosira miniscula, Strain CCMP1093" /LENGTH=508 /DNA_ID=CAMNT_0025960585 /DNA_START=143 /DNA_END=1669 /DNA_ORIENTATION=+